MRRLRTAAWPAAVALIAGAAATSASAGQAALDRLPRSVFDVVPPSAHVRGAPGEMAVRPQPCRTLPNAETRRRIVDVAVQEWAYFGFRILDQRELSVRRDAAANDGGDDRDGRGGGRRLGRLPLEEAARVAASIAGYWAITPEGSWIVQKQNADWRSPYGLAVRWNAPWSAAFISWVMCEAGLGTSDQFQRAIAHHAYIDQAIRARDGRAPQAAYAAYDPGETAITPGDMLCSSRRPAYRTIAERRRQPGVGARSHCDIVVKVDAARERILVIGGNVRGAVSLKLLHAEREEGAPLRLLDMEEDARPIFAHLKLRAEPIGASALDTTPTIASFGCTIGRRPTAALAAAHAAVLDAIAARC
jgi:hypothetical protein